jgi:flavin-dependent dehydrogenase
MNPITIAGGGLAGLTLGIGLRQHDVPVTIWEAGHYPRHKVCGEFISGRGQDTLQKLGVLDRLGGRWARDAAFYVGADATRVALPQPALCIARQVLDAFLAQEFRRLGGELLEGRRWRGDFAQPSLVRATGHRIEPVVNGWRWFGLKVHARGVELAADLELHLRRDGYVGLCRLPDRVNICGLFRTREPIHDLRQTWRRYLLDGLSVREVDESSFCAVAGIDLTPHARTGTGELVIGDALTMIAPATGNGMAMALEAAENATEPLARYARGDAAWETTRQSVAAQCRQRFAGRLRVAAQLQRVLFQPVLRRTLLGATRCCPAIFRQLFLQTR